MAKYKPVKVGIIGIGRAGWGMHRTEMAPKPTKFQIVAGADLVEERALKLESDTGATPYTDYKDLLKDDNVELAVVATRSDSHAQIVVDALKAGKHVIAEKPFGLNVREVDRIIRAADKAKGKLLVRQNRRYDDDYLHIREVMKSKVLGDIFMVKLYRQGYQRRADWQTLEQFGGGHINNWGPHIVDHGLLLLESEVKEFWADVKLIAARGDAEDHFKLILKGKNDRVVDIEVSMGMAKSAPAWQIFGTRGALTCDGTKTELRYLDPKQKLKPVKADPGNPPMEGAFGNKETLKWVEKKVDAKPKKKHPDFYDAVFDTLKKGKKFGVTPQEARQVVYWSEKARKKGW